MKRRVLVLVALGVAGVALLAPAEDGESLGFGFGGSGIAALFPKLESVNTYLAENGVDPLGVVLFGGGGGGRGGAIGGMSFGGMGFGITATSTGGGAAAELSVGAGGFDLGLAVGGDGSSVLTLGVVLGGGATVLEFSPSAIEPQGIVPTPTTRTIGRAFAMVMPYVSFEAQVLPFAGLEVRIGYLVPVVGFDFGEPVGIPAPSLDLSGPFGSVCFVFGGIGGGGSEAGDVETSVSGTLELTGAARLTLESHSGDIVITSYAPAATQTGSRRVVEWTAACAGDEASVEAQSGPDGAVLRTVGEKRVDYALRVPFGTDLNLLSGAGEIHIVGHTADKVRVALGAGDLSLADSRVGDVSLSVGAGQIAVHLLSLRSLSAHAGAGSIDVWLPPDVSATVSASSGIGETSVVGFAGMRLRESQFFLTQSTEAVLGSGSSTCTLSVGIGEIVVQPIKAVMVGKPG